MRLPAFLNRIAKFGIPGQRPGEKPLQVAALPYRRGVNGTIEILLVTSKGGGRWIVPKGWPMRGKSLAESAAQEAFEEAGVQGYVSASEVGRFPHDKDRSLLPPLPCTVLVFPLAVAKELSSWPEAGQRERRWFPAPAAAQTVQSPQLAKLISGFSPAP